jgi:hypothetical protein
LQKRFNSVVKKCGVSQKDIDAVDCVLGNQRKLNRVPTSYNLYYHKSSESERDEKNRIVEVLT